MALESIISLKVSELSAVGLACQACCEAPAKLAGESASPKPKAALEYRHAPPETRPGPIAVRLLGYDIAPLLFELSILVAHPTASRALQHQQLQQQPWPGGQIRMVSRARAPFTRAVRAPVRHAAASSGRRCPHQPRRQAFP